MATITSEPSPLDLGTQASTGPGTSAGPVLAWCSVLLMTLARVYRAFFLTLLVVALIPALWGWESYVVRSGSMEPALSVGDVAVAQPFASGSKVPVGRVMLFTPPNALSGHETRIHRVVENLGDGTYTTAGDANRSVDPEPVPATSFQAQPVICVPFIAAGLTWWYDRDVAKLLILLLVTAAAMYFSVRPPSDPRHRRRERNQARRAGAQSGRLLQRYVVPVATSVVIIATAISLTASATAAYTATAANASSTWTVSTTLAHRVSLASPGATVRGTVPLSATLSNTDGVAYSVRMEYSAPGSASWRTICTKASAPYTCSWATSGWTNGAYDLRAVATSASTTLTSTVVEGIVVDNSVNTIVLNDPGPILSGTITLTAAASSNSGVASVRFQGAPAGTGDWNDLCLDSSSPYTCTYNTTAAPDGAYDLRAILTNRLGGTTTSAILANRRVDNTAPGGFDVQTTNGDRAGKLDGGDTMTFTYDEQMKLSSFVAGWNGSGLPVTLRLRSGNLMGLGNNDDSVDIWRNGTLVNLGLVNLRQNYISNNRTALFDATMTASSTAINGAIVTTVTITVGDQSDGQGVRTVTSSSDMTWAPSSSATDLGGLRTNTSTVTESGWFDRQF